MLMKNIMAKSHPDIMLAGASDGGVNGTPDEVAFAAQRVGYYNKYFNAPLRMAQFWDDPNDLKMGPLPKFAGGEGSTVFWTTGAALLQAWSEQGEGSRICQGADLRPADLERFNCWNRNCPSRTACHRISLSTLVGNQADQIGYLTLWTSSADSWTRPRRSPTTSLASNSSSLANQFGNLTSKGEEKNPRVAMQNVVDAVQAEMKRG